MSVEEMRKVYLENIHPEVVQRNICMGRRNWNVCDYGNQYAGNGQECWLQGKCCCCVRCQVVDVD